MDDSIFKIKKSLHGGFCDEDGDILLIENDGVLTLPGGIPCRKNIIQCPHPDERWAGDFLGYRMKKQAGYFSPFAVQAMPAIYIAYGEDFEVEFSAILVGEINSREVKEPKAQFYQIDEIVEFGESGKLTRPQYLLALRMCASRDWPSLPYVRKVAGNALREQHQ
jgi:hypothetical protein